MRLFLLKCLGITLLCCLYSIFLSAQTGPAGVNSGTVLWLDASDVNAGGAAPTIGSTVSSWKDKSGTNHNATSTGANTAIYTSGGANGTPVIRFNRSSATSGTGFTVNGVDIRGVTSPAVTIFAVYRQGTNDGNNQAVWGNDNGGTLQRFFHSKWNTGATDGSLSTGGAAAVVAGASRVGETRLVTGVYSNGASASAVYLNGKRLSTFTDLTAASSGQSAFKIGSDGDDNYFNGDVSEIIVYNRKLTDCELETVNRYLADKYTTDFNNIAANYTLGVPVNEDINGVGKPVSACGGNYTIATASSDIVMVTNPSSSSTAGVVLTFANDRQGYTSSSETPPAYSSRIKQRWRADLNGNIGTVDICFNLQNLGIDVGNSGNFALLIDKDGNFSDATVISTGVSIFIDRVCISNVPITKGDYFTLAIRASTSDASSITSPNKGLFQKASFTIPTVIDNQLQVKGNDTITNGRVYIDSNFISGDVLGWNAGALPAGVTGAYNATTGALSFTGKATAAQWQVIFRTVTFSTSSPNITDRSTRFVLGNVISYTVGSKPHYYEYVTTPMNWVDAKAAAAARTLYGLQGYLATSTSQIENDFLKARLSSDGWVGASCNLAQVNSVSATQYANQAAVDGKYYWVTGPEAGLAISTGLLTPVAVGGAYTNWNADEPNNYQNTNEQFVQLYSTNAGKWNDLPLTSLLGYVVEYGGYASDAVINIEYNRIVRSAPAAPAITGITTDSNIGSDKITNDATLVFTGTSPNSAKVTVLREGVVIGNVTASNTGAWSFDYTGTSLTDGTYNFTAVDTVASVESAMSVVFQVTIDLTAPAKPATPTLLRGGNSINTQRPTFTGSAEPGSTVTVYSNGTLVGTGKADSTGTWIITATVNIGTGTRSITARAMDIAGNNSVLSDVFSVTLDTTPPAAPTRPVLAGGTAGVISNSHPTITGTVPEGNTTVLIIQDGVVIDSVVANAGGAYTYTFVNALPDATYSITVRDRDPAGNLSAASPALSIRVDTTAPATPDAPVLVGGNNGIISNHFPTITGSAEANSIVIIFKDGVAVDSVTADGSGAYIYTFVTSLPDAVYSITVKAKDAIGNVSGMSPALSIKVDTTAPVRPAAPLLAGGNNGVIGSSTPTIYGVAEANSKVIIYRGGLVVDSVNADASGNYTYTFPFLADATYSIAVRSRDAAGNISLTSPALSMTVDTTVPTTPTAPLLVGGVNGVISNHMPTITGTAEVNSTVIIYKDGVAVDSVPADGAGDYTYTFTTPLADGTYSITVKDKDAAGNVSALSPALSITVDTTAPATPAAPVLTGGTNGWINDNTPTITGVAEANSTVLIYRDGIAAGTTTTDASGNYTYTFTTLADGAYNITVRNRDIAGNISAMSPALNINIDTTSPTTPTAPVLVGGNNGVISDNTPSITGIAEENSTVIIYKDGIAVDSVTADAGGNYAYTFATLADGTYSVTVKDKDAMGNVSAMSPALSITVDTTAPATPDAPVLVGGVNGVTADNTPTITGVAEANSTVIIYRGGVIVTSVTADASGNYTYTFTTPLADGTYSITVKSRDAAGNVSAFSPALSITVDTTAPTTPGAPVLVGGNNGVTADNTPTITGSAEANSTVIIYKGGIAVDSVTADASGDYTYTFTTPLADGTYSITVKDKDAVGNVSAASPALSITVDTAAPATPAAPVLVGGINGVISDNTPTISGVAEANSTVIIYKGGIAVDSVTADATGNYTYTFTTPLADDTYSITVKDKDAAGNVSAMSAALSITVDTTAPATPAAPVLVGGNNGVTADNTPTITGVAEANSTVIIYKGGIAVDSVTADASGDYTYTFTTPLADGTYSITVKDKDAAGNVSAASPVLSITIDTTAPTTPAAPVLVGGFNGVTNDNTPAITGVAEANSTVIIYKDGIVVDSVTANASGNYTYTFTTALADGTYSITVKDKDAAGNVSAMSPALSITVDTVVPSTPFAPVLVGGNNNMTKDNTPAIRGVAEANTTVIIYKDGVVVDSVSVDVNGDYNYTFTTPLADGTYSITVKDKDAAGNLSPMSPALSMTVDTSVPATPAAPVLVGGTNGVTSDNTPTITGVAEANSTVIIYKGGIAVDSVTADASGNYTYTFTTPLADATYSITVKDKDVAGNVSPVSPVLSFRVDTTPPATPAAPVLVGGTNGVTADNTPTITGAAEANSTVIIYKGGIAVDSVTADASGNYTYTFTTPLADGTYSITVKSKDAIGNVSAMSPALSFRVDTTAPATPAAPLLVGGTNGITKDATPDITGVAEASSTVTIYRDGVSAGTATADASGNYNYTFTTDLTDGAHAITVTSTDAAGNVSGMSPALNIVVDANSPETPPAPELVSGNNGVSTTDPTPDIKGKAEANSLVTVYSDGVTAGAANADANGDYTFTFPAELMDGTHAITVTATDEVGNVSDMSPVLNIVVDVHPPARPPAPVLVNPADSVTRDATPDIKGKAEANSTVTIYSDQVEVGTTKADASGNYTFTFTTDLADGIHNITVTATDTASNVSPVSPALSFLIDTHAPGRPTAPVLVSGIDGLTNDATPDITGKAEPNSTVTIYADGTAAGTAPVDANGNYNFTFPDKLGEGPHSITATATDAAGNTSENQSPALNIVIDTKPPATPSTPILVDGVNAVVKTTKPTVIGTVEPNATVIIYDGGVEVGTTKADNSGKWIYTFDPGISNGVHTVTVTATDAAGNVSAVSAELPFTVDAMVPDVPLPPRLPGVNGFVNITTPAITGQGQPGTMITIYTDGTKSGTALVDANGNWTYTYNPPLAESVHNINVTASTIDGANESGHSETVKLTIDLVGPTVKLSSNRATGAVVNGTVTVTVTFSEGVSGFSWDDLKITNAKVVGFTQVSSGIYQVLVSPTANGAVTVLVPKNAGFDVIGNGNAESELLTMNMKPNVGIDQVYPMPATDVINIRLTGVDDEQAVVKMTNMAGQVLLHQQNIIKEGVLSLNVQKLPSGTYVLLVVLEKGSYNTTVVIAR
jgi:outer membrane usher protein FimD/PapC